MNTQESLSFDCTEAISFKVIKEDSYFSFSVLEEAPERSKKVCSNVFPEPTTTIYRYSSPDKKNTLKLKTNFNIAMHAHNLEENSEENFLKLTEDSGGNANGNWKNEDDPDNFPFADMASIIHSDSNQSFFMTDEDESIELINISMSVNEHFVEVIEGYI